MAAVQPVSLRRLPSPLLQCEAAQSQGIAPVPETRVPAPFADEAGGHVTNLP